MAKRFVRLEYVAIDKLVELSDSAIRVYLVLCKYRNNQTGFCYPSQKRIAREANISDRQVRRALNELNTAYLICRLKREENKPGRHCEYWVVEQPEQKQSNRTPMSGSNRTPMSGL